MSNNIDITFSADDKSAQAALDRMQNKLNQTERKLEKLRTVSRNVSRENRSGFDQSTAAIGRMTSRLTGMMAGMFSLQKAVRAIGQEWEETARKQEASRIATLEPAQAIREARIAFVPDKTLKDSQLEQVIQNLAKETRSETKTVAIALQTAFSAKGSQTNQVAVEAVRQALRMDPSNPAQAAILAGRFLDVAKFSGSTDIRANAGFIQNVQSASRVTTSEKVGANIVPAIGGMTFLGDTPEQGAELLAAATQLLGDEQGRISANAVLTLGNQLKEFIPQRAKTGKFRGQYVAKDQRFGEFAIPESQFKEFEKATSTQERIAVMQRNEELRRAFIATASFQTKPEQQMLGLLRADPRAVEELRQARETIKPIGTGQRALFEEKIAQLEGGKLQSNLTAEQEFKAREESLLLGNTPSQRFAFARSSVERVMANIDRPGIDKAQNDAVKLALNVAIKDAETKLAQGKAVGPPERAAAAALRQLRTKPFFWGEGEMSREHLQYLQQEIKKLEEEGLKRGNVLPEYQTKAQEKMMRDRDAAGVSRNFMGPVQSSGVQQEMSEQTKVLKEISGKLDQPTTPRQTERPSSRLSRGSN